MKFKNLFKKISNKYLFLPIILFGLFVFSLNADAYTIRQGSDYVVCTSQEQDALVASGILFMDVTIDDSACAAAEPDPTFEATFPTCGNKGYSSTNVSSVCTGSDCPTTNTTQNFKVYYPKWGGGGPYLNKNTSSLPIWLCKSGATSTSTANCVSTDTSVGSLHFSGHEFWFDSDGQKTLSSITGNANLSYKSGGQVSIPFNGQILSLNDKVKLDIENRFRGSEPGNAARIIASFYKTNVISYTPCSGPADGTVPVTNSAPSLFVR